MREIKFRAKSNGTGRWWFGDLFYDQVEPGIPFINNGKGTICQCVKGTVGQFTGLLDKNKKPIYEGDIVKCDKLKDEIGEVKFGHPFCQGFYVRIYNLIKKERTSWYVLTIESKKELEIIGNIHDNGDLLE